MDKIDYLAQKKAELRDALTKLFPKSQNPTPSAKKLQEAAKNLPPPKNPKVYKDEHDELADLVIGFSEILTDDEFTQLPDISVKTGIAIGKRADEASKYNSYWSQIIEKQLKTLETSRVRSKSAKLHDEKYYAKQREFVKAMYQKHMHKKTTVAAKHIAVELEKYIAQENLPVEKTKKNGNEEWESWVTNEIRKINKNQKDIKNN